MDCQELWQYDIPNDALPDATYACALLKTRRPCRRVLRYDSNDATLQVPYGVVLCMHAGGMIERIIALVIATCRYFLTMLFIDIKDRLWQLAHATI